MEIDPLFDRIAIAAMDQGFAPEGIHLGASEHRYYLRLEKEGVFSERWIEKVALEDAMFPVERFEVQQLDNQIAECLAEEGAFTPTRFPAGALRSTA